MLKTMWTVIKSVTNVRSWKVEAVWNHFSERQNVRQTEALNMMLGDYIDWKNLCGSSRWWLLWPSGFIQRFYQFAEIESLI